MDFTRINQDDGEAGWTGTIESEALMIFILLRCTCDMFEHIEEVKISSTTDAALLDNHMPFSEALLLSQ